MHSLMKTNFGLRGNDRKRFSKRIDPESRQKHQFPYMKRQTSKQNSYSPLFEYIHIHFILINGTFHQEGVTYHAHFH
jgi:hypothetical protein